VSLQQDNPIVAVQIDRRPFVRAFKITAIVGLFFIVLYLSWIFLTEFQSISLPFFLSVILMLLLEPPVNNLESRGLSRFQATFVIFLAITGLFVLFGYLVFPVLRDQVQSIQAQVENGEIQSRFSDLAVQVQQKLSFLSATGQQGDLSAKIEEAIARFQKNLLSLAMGLVSAFSNIIIIPFITFFLLKDGPSMKKKLIEKVPNRYFEMVLNLMYKIEQQLGGYIRGQLIDAFLVGVLSIIALFILDIKYYILIGAIAGLANLIPYFGPIVGAIPAILVSLMHNPSLTPIIWIAVAFALVQLVDNVLISPLVVAKSVNIHPLIVIVVIFIGERLLGLLGMLLAVPITAILNVIVKETIWSFKNYRLL